MTANPIETVYLWLGQPDVGTEHMLMVHVQDPTAGPIYRPLMGLSEPDARALTDLAQQAATALGVTAVLREYRVTRVENSLGVPTGGPAVLSTIRGDDHRDPYVGEGADGARRSAQIDREEADQLEPGTTQYDYVLASAERWDQQARDLDGAGS
jgi:hypothetical protein